MLTSSLFLETGNHIRQKSKETDEMCCMHWQKITEKRFYFCITQNLFAMVLYGAMTLLRESMFV